MTVHFTPEQEKLLQELDLHLHHAAEVAADYERQFGNCPQMEKLTRVGNRQITLAAKAEPLAIHAPHFRENIL